MSLGLEVGIVADLKANDREGCEFYRQQFESINHALVAADLPLHHEPEGLSGGVWSCDVALSALHALRRVAAYEALGYDIPAPGSDKASRDPVVVDYYREFESTPLVWLRRLLFRSSRRELRFQHLMVHSDGEGYYLPVEFDKVLRTHPSLRIAGGRIGSSPVLLEECEELATLLDIPESLSEDSQELRRAIEPDRQSETSCRWRQYAQESLACACLMEACRVSLTYGAAIVFT